MDFTPHQLAEGRVNPSMPLDSGFPLEFFGNDEQTVVAAAAPCAGVSGVQGRIVDQLQTKRAQGGEALAQERLEVIGISGQRIHAGKTFLKGLTLTLA